MSFNSLLVILSSLSSLLLALGVNGASRNDLLLDPNSILKTIESEDGEVIDCVDIYKQSAFRHPRLRNHILQMKPSSHPIGFEPKSTSHWDNSSVLNFQRWRKNGEYCPEGTIPVVRFSQENFPHKTTHPLGSSTNELTPTGFQAEYAVAYLPGSNFHGAIGDVSIWNPRVLQKEISGAQLWVTDSVDRSTADAIEAGWTIAPAATNPTLFVYYTANGYRTGCLNVNCPGFVQTNPRVALGAIIDPPSTYGGPQRKLAMTIHRDDETGHWWFNLEGQDVGYWPVNIFNNVLRGTATLIQWGGEVVNSNPRGFHTSTEMGSGHFPDEGYGKAAWFTNLKYISDRGRVFDANKMTAYASRPDCYDIELQKWASDVGVHFLYGGPGFSPACLH